MMVFVFQYSCLRSSPHAHGGCDASIITGRVVWRPLEGAPKDTSFQGRPGIHAVGVRSGGIPIQISADLVLLCPLYRLAAMAINLVVLHGRDLSTGS